MLEVIICINGIPALDAGIFWAIRAGGFLHREEAVFLPQGFYDKAARKKVCL